MVDLGDDLDVEGAVVGEVARLLAEEFVEPAQILGRAPPARRSRPETQRASRCTPRAE